MVLIIPLTCHDNGQRWKYPPLMAEIGRLSAKYSNGTDTSANMATGFRPGV